MPAVVDRGPGFASIADELAELAASHVRVGIVERHSIGSPGTGVSADPAIGYDRSPGDITLAQKAVYHEKGGKNDSPPKRSFILQAVDSRTVEIEGIESEEINKVLAGKQSGAAALRRLGFDVAMMMRTVIETQENMRALKSSTIDQRAKHGISGTKALAATRQMLNAIGFEVRAD